MRPHRATSLVEVFEMNDLVWLAVLAGLLLLTLAYARFCEKA